MSCWIVPPIAGLIEPSPAPEFFIDKIGGIELISAGWVRIYGCADQMPLEVVACKPQRIVQVKIVRPLATLPDAILSMVRCFSGDTDALVRPQGPFMPHLVQ